MSATPATPAVATVPRRLVVLAPNWLGDAVMALPLIRDLAEAWPDTTIIVAARKSVAPLFSMVPDVDGLIVLERGDLVPGATRANTNAERLAAAGFDAALLLPNSFASAWLVRRAGIAERWGYARDLRRALLTRAIPRRRYRHQVEYYQALGAALGIPPGPPFARVVVPEEALADASRLLADRAIDAQTPFVVFAPGAAYGRAKQWLPERFAALADTLDGRGIRTVLVGANGDRPACLEIARMVPAVDLSGRTDLRTLAGVLAHARAVVANDSGAMHLAAAVGARVTAVFGPTDDEKTSPLRASGDAPAPAIVASNVWCRPCMLRECPIDHRCMSRISAERVLETLPVGAP